jgi:hypothetical protein
MTTISGIIPKFTGHSIVGARIAGLTLDPATGIYTVGTVFDLSDNTIESIDAMTFTPSLDNEEISAANAGFRNHVPIKWDIDTEVREIKAANGGSILLGVANEFAYFRAELLSTDGTNYQLVQTVNVIVSLDDEYAEGKSVNVLRGASVGLPISVTSGNSAELTGAYS